MTNIYISIYQCSLSHLSRYIHWPALFFKCISLESSAAAWNIRYLLFNRYHIYYLITYCGLGKFFNLDNCDLIEILVAERLLYLWHSDVCTRTTMWTPGSPSLFCPSEQQSTWTEQHFLSQWLPYLLHRWMELIWMLDNWSLLCKSIQIRYLKRFGTYVKKFVKVVKVIEVIKVLKVLKSKSLAFFSLCVLVF